MDLPKYAKLEIERRALVDPDLCPDFADERFYLIDDLYFDGGRLRLRAMTDSKTAHQTFKLCKKYASNDAISGPIVNIYLDAAEHAAFTRLPSRSIRKRRHRQKVGGVTFAIDFFEGDLEGLILCEAEASTPQAVRAIVFPLWASVEVSDDPFFRGGNLCRVSRKALAARTREMWGAG